MLESLMSGSDIEAEAQMIRDFCSEIPRLNPKYTNQFLVVSKLDHGMVGASFDPIVVNLIILSVIKCKALKILVLALNFPDWPIGTKVESLRPNMGYLV